MVKTSSASVVRPHHLTVDVNHDHLSGLTRCHPAVGIAELVWNSLDADATDVNVWLREAAGARPFQASFEQRKS